MMNKTFFESIYKEALKNNLQEGNLNEMAQAYAPQIRQFCAIHPEFAFLYKNPAHTASGTPAKARYDALVDEFYEMFPDMANTDRLDRNGNVNLYVAFGDAPASTPVAHRKTPLEKALSHMNK